MDGVKVGGQGERTSHLEIKFVVKPMNIFTSLRNKKYMTPVSLFLIASSICLSVSHVAFPVLCTPYSSSSSISSTKSYP